MCVARAQVAFTLAARDRRVCSSVRKQVEVQVGENDLETEKTETNRLVSSQLCLHWKALSSMHDLSHTISCSNLTKYKKAGPRHQKWRKLLFLQTLCP